VNKDGELYGGFETASAKPVWFRNKRPECVLEESVADLVMRQLATLGFKDFTKRPADAIAKKWVPKDLDASK
jgi:hypothetical protein